MSEKTLLFVLNHMDWFFSHRLPVALEAAKRGWKIKVAATGAASDDRLKAYGFQGIDLPSQEGRLNPLRELKILLSMRSIIKEHKPDMVHAVTLKYVLNAGLAARTIKDSKIVYTIAGLGFLFSPTSKLAAALRLMVSPFLRLALNKKASHLIVQNHDDERVLLGYNLVKPDKVSVIKGSGVDLDDFSYTPEQPSGTPVILMASRLLGEKGVKEFCQAARLIKEKTIEADFQLAGSFDTKNPDTLSEADLKPYIEDGSITFLGHVKNMRERMVDATIITLPSYYGEGVPKVLLEAAAIGRPIITTDHVGCREVVDNNSNGLLIAPKSAKALADAVELLLNEPGLCQKMGEAGRKKAEAEFSADAVAAKTCDIYDAVLGL